VSAAPTIKQLRLTTKASGVPDAAQLAAIREHTLREFAAEELVVREFVLAHNGIDRDNEVMDEPLLSDFARTIAGKGTYINHPTSWRSEGGPAEGRVFAARVERMSFDQARTILREPTLQFPPDRFDAALLYTSCFFVKTAENEAFLLKMDAGIVGDISIGFIAAGPVRIRDSEGRELNAYRWQSPGEALEQSLVWLGAQPGARAIKHAQRSENDVDQNTHEKAMTEKQATIDALTKRAEVAEKDAKLLAALKDALGKDDAVLVDSPAALVEAVQAGRAHTKSMIDDLITSDRHMKLVGDSAEDVEKARKAYEAMPATRIAAIHKHARDHFGPGKAPAGNGSVVQGGDPNARAPGSATDTDQTNKAAGPFSSPLLAG